MARSKKNKDGYNDPFPKRLRELMSQNGTTQDQLAEIIQKTRQTVSQYTNGISEPGYGTLVKIADYFCVSIDYLLGRTKTKSADETEQAIIEYTGLSEENVQVLHGMSKRIYEKGISKNDGNTVSFDGNKPFIDCLNDLLDAMYNDRDFLMNHYIRLRRKAMKNETVDFWYVMGDCGGPIPGFEHAEYPDSKMQIEFDNELVEYHCLKIAKAIEEGFLKKYLGTPEDIERFKKDVDDEQARIEALRREQNGTHRED